jgi:hypothetical protein
MEVEWCYIVNFCLIYVFAIVDENLGTYIIPLTKVVKCGNNEKE